MWTRSSSNRFWTAYSKPNYNTNIHYNKNLIATIILITITIVVTIMVVRNSMLMMLSYHWEGSNVLF